MRLPQLPVDDLTVDAVLAHLDAAGIPAVRAGTAEPTLEALPDPASHSGTDLGLPPGGTDVRLTTDGDGLRNPGGEATHRPDEVRGKGPEPPDRRGRRGDRPGAARVGLRRTGWDPSDRTLGGEGVSPTEGSLDEATVATLEEILTTGFEQSGMPGVAAYVRIGDGEWTEALGVGDLETQEPFDPEAHVRIASITKTFTATAVLELVDRGEISLDDTLDEYVPDITNGDRVTIRDLLAMTSGVWDFTSDEEPHGRVGRRHDDAVDPRRDDRADQGQARQLRAGRPGAVHRLQLRAALLHPRRGHRHDPRRGGAHDGDRAVGPRRHPLPPRPTSRASPTPTSRATDPRESSSASLDELIPVGDINPEVASGAGNMTSTMADLAVWAEALAAGDLLSPDSRPSASSPAASRARPSTWATGSG